MKAFCRVVRDLFTLNLLVFSFSPSLASNYYHTSELINSLRCKFRDPSHENENENAKEKTQKGRYDDLMAILVPARQRGFSHCIAEKRRYAEESSVFAGLTYEDRIRIKIDLHEKVLAAKTHYGLERYCQKELAFAELQTLDGEHFEGLRKFLRQLFYARTFQDRPIQEYLIPRSKRTLSSNELRHLAQLILTELLDQNGGFKEFLDDDLRKISEHYQELSLDPRLREFVMLFFQHDFRNLFWSNLVVSGSAGRLVGRAYEDTIHPSSGELLYRSALSSAKQTAVDIYQSAIKYALEKSFAKMKLFPEETPLELKPLYPKNIRENCIRLVDFQYRNDRLKLSKSAYEIFTNKLSPLVNAANGKEHSDFRQLENTPEIVHPWLRPSLMQCVMTVESPTISPEEVVDHYCYAKGSRRISTAITPYQFTITTFHDYFSSERLYTLDPTLMLPPFQSKRDLIRAHHRGLLGDPVLAAEYFVDFLNYNLKFGTRGNRVLAAMSNQNSSLTPEEIEAAQEYAVKRAIERYNNTSFYYPVIKGCMSCLDHPFMRRNKDFRVLCSTATKVTTGNAKIYAERRCKKDDIACLQQETFHYMNRDFEHSFTGKVRMCLNETRENSIKNCLTKIKKLPRLRREAEAFASPEESRERLEETRARCENGGWRSS